MVASVTAHRKAHPEQNRERRRRYREKKRQAQQAQQANTVEQIEEHEADDTTKGLPAYKWKFKPCADKPTIANLQKIPRDKSGNEQFLGNLRAMPSLSVSYLRLIWTEAPHRPDIYDDLVRLLMQYDPSHQKLLAIS